MYTVETDCEKSFGGLKSKHTHINGKINVKNRS